MVYRYDLISGKVNHVAYQPNQADQYYHRYSYDAENRLTLVETSQDSVHWEKDSRYEYYKHGPLARTTLGDQLVQGVDYAYTIQGWLKGVNATTLNPDHEMGQDGRDGGPNQYVARDAFSFSLNYFAGDYSSISGNLVFPGSSAYLGTAYRPLYNGNIGSMTVNIGKFNQPMLYNYKYDQLNRLTRMDAFTGLDEINNDWSELVLSDSYKERIEYDANGNILKYLRYGTEGNQMDDLAYHYNLNVSVQLINNQLNHVSDQVGDGDYAIDIDDQAEDNYEYDAIGNLIKDVAEGIDNIEWTVYGKIRRIEKSGDPNGVISIDYSYDASGNRISKKVSYDTDEVKITWYVRDASGNVMAVYESVGSGDDFGEYSLELSEQHLYGTLRLGIVKRNLDVRTAFADTGSIASFTRGFKSYELSNHLGNVLEISRILGRKKR